MAPVPIFNGHVDDNGRLALFAVEAAMRLKHLRSLAGKDVEVVVRKKRTQRSLDQNAYWHAVPFPILAEHWGEDIETAKLLILGECFGWKDTKDGHRLPMKPHTSLLTTEEGTFLTDWIPPWAMTNFNVDIPLPKETDFS